MLLHYFVVLCFSILSSQILGVQSACEKPINISGVISYTSSQRRISYERKCWFIEPSEDEVVHLSVEELNLRDPYCDSAYVEVQDDSNGRIEKLCQSEYRYNQRGNWTKTFFGVHVSLILRNTRDYAIIRLSYKKESLICTKKNHFRCSPSHCIRSNQVCDGIPDCVDGSDEQDCGHLSQTVSDHLTQAIHLSDLMGVQSTCERPQNISGVISYTSSQRRIVNERKCWYIEPPKDGVVHLSVEELNLRDPYCDSAYIVVLDDDNGSTEKLCQSEYRYNQRGNWTKTFVGAVNVSLILRNTWDYAIIRLSYKRESIICARKNHFRCSPSHCIRSNQVCDGIPDCEDGSDEQDCGVIGVRDANATRTYAINWLKKHQTNFGWGRNTHRAITALYLTNAAHFLGNKMEEEVLVKQLQLKMATALLRNSTDPMSVNELSMYVNALTATCHNDRNIFSKDLLKILAERTFSAPSPSPGAYLTLCIAKWPLTSFNVQTLVEHLYKDSEYEFRTEIQAMTVLALTCIKERTDFLNDDNATYIFNATVGNLMADQQDDGSFGNPHTTAMVTQALIASGENYSWRWNKTSAMQFLMGHLKSSSVDFLSVYLTLPLLTGKTLADIGRVHCKDNYRKLDEDDDILDVIDQLGGSNRVQFSLYIGDHKDVVHTIYLRVPDNTTAYDVMKIAQVADPKYKFSYHVKKDHVYIYAIAGITNDMEAGKYWLFYSQLPQTKELKHHTASPDQIAVGKNEHLIMWYKTANI